MRIAVSHPESIPAAGIASLVTGMLDVSVNLVSYDSENLETLSASHDVVICDFDAAARLLELRRNRLNPPRIIVYCLRSNPAEIQSAISSGISGFLGAGCTRDELVQAVESARRGLCYISPAVAARLSDVPLCESLTERERQVLRSLEQGRRNSEIAVSMAISPGTVKTHLKAIFQKLQVHNRTELCMRARQLGLLSN